MKLLLIGHGRMGQLIEQLAPSYGASVVDIVTSRSGDIASVEPDVVAIDFSLPDAVPVTLPRLAARGINVVIGTTGWQAHAERLREIAGAANIGVLAAANFSVGVHIFALAVAAAARPFAGQDVGAWIHEAHHAAKKDAPSGTALMLKGTIEAAGYSKPIDISSTRAGSIPGTHTVGFDGAAETVTFTHQVRDRAVFAHGALAAAKWLQGRRGWFSMRDMFTGD